MPAPHAVCVCVKYADFLQLVVPSWRPLFDRIVIATAPDDKETQAVCRQHSLEFVETWAFYHNGSRFNKGAGLNAALQHLGALPAAQWVGILDADVYFPPGFQLDPTGWDPRCCYTAVRRMCKTREEWDRYCQDGRLDRFPRYMDGRIWWALGYLQLFRWDWFQTHPQLKGRHPEGLTAGKIDTVFAKAFGRPNDRCQRLLGPDVLHLGQNGKNWCGRKSARFEQGA